MITGKLLVSGSTKSALKRLKPLIPHLCGTPAARGQLQAKMFSAVLLGNPKRKGRARGPADPGETCNSQFQVTLTHPKIQAL